MESSLNQANAVFPAWAGMNLVRNNMQIGTGCVPRVGGDEPFFYCIA